MHTTASPTYYEALAADPELMQIDWDLPETIKFIKLAQYLKPYLSSMLRFADLDTAPPHLPTMIHDFFKFSLDISDEQVKIAWDGLRVAIWKSHRDDADGPVAAFSKVSEYAQDILIHGIVRDIGKLTRCCFVYRVVWVNGREFPGVINLFPPTRICEEESCARGYKTSTGYLQPQELGDERVYQVTVFTQAYGPLPGYAASLACPSKFACSLPFLGGSRAHQHVVNDTTTIILFTWGSPSELITQAALSS